MSDRLERQSLLLMGAALVGHVGNYAYHFITGRMVPEGEYGLMMALFGLVNLILLPMSALNISLARNVAALQQAGKTGAVSTLLFRWFHRCVLIGAAGLVVVWAASPWLQSLLGVTRMAPLLLAACIPVLNLLLTLSGAGLQGLQLFRGLAFRGSMLFVVRALAVGGCLSLGFAAAGWGLLAHLLGMGAALLLSGSVLLRHLPARDPDAPRVAVLKGSFTSFPVLLAFSALMTADVVLVRALESEAVSGQFAQSATLGRMILWLPLPIAQVMFPKVVRDSLPTAAQRSTLRKAMFYTVVLILITLSGAWLLGPLLFQFLFGIEATPEQIHWFRGISVCMALLGPVYVVMQYELARDRVRNLLPLCGLALVYVASAWFRSVSPGELIGFLGVASGLSLLTAGRALAAEAGPPSFP